jgi:hypothetical protein
MIFGTPNLLVQTLWRLVCANYNVANLKILFTPAVGRPTRLSVRVTTI